MVFEYEGDLFVCLLWDCQLTWVKDDMPDSEVTGLGTMAFRHNFEFNAAFDWMRNECYSEFKKIKI